MKKLIILSLTLLIVACSQGEKPQSNALNLDLWKSGTTTSQGCNYYTLTKWKACK